MIEIIALVYLTRNIGKLANQKGLKPSTWKLYTVLAWFAGEIVGVLIGIMFFEEIASAIFLGIALAISSFFIVKAALAKKPDQLMDEEIEQIGQPQV